MRGFITGRHVLTNLTLIWKEFGAACVFRCFVALASREQTTFLDIAFKTSSR